MNIKNAVQIIKNEHPNRTAIGYWVVDDGIIINTKLDDLQDDVDEPGQYLIKNDGAVLGVLPFKYHLTMDTMRKI